MEPKKIRVIDMLQYLGRLQHINIIDGSYDNVILDYYTSAFEGKYDDIDAELLGKEVTEITLNSKDNTTVLNIGERITRAD